MSFASRRPILTFLLLMYPLAWALVAAAFVLHLPLEPAVALSTVVGILGPAVLVTYWTGGRAAVLTNTWEEVAWAGFVQSRLTARHGLLTGAVLTGPLFALQHLPIIDDDR